MEAEKFFADIAKIVLKDSIHPVFRQYNLSLQKEYILTFTVFKKSYNQKEKREE